MAGAGAIADRRWLRGGSAQNRGSAGRSREPKRYRLEDQQTTPTASRRRPALSIAVLLFITALSACAQNSFQLQGGAPAIDLKSPLAAEVLMEVDDVAVTWGTGRVGDALKSALVRNGTFGQIHFPIYPARAVANKLRIVARGNIETDAGGAVGKSVATGLLMFLPVGVLQYRDVFAISAEISLLGEGGKSGPVTVESKVAADHTMFNGPETYALQAQRMLLDDLAGRISTALADHPEWFGR